MSDQADKAADNLRVWKASYSETGKTRGGPCVWLYNPKGEAVVLMFPQDRPEAEGVVSEIVNGLNASLIRSHTAPRELVDSLRKVAASKDNEATGYPVWYIVDPRQMMSRDVGRLVSMITGPFFSRESATETMKALRHRYKNPSVYCDSGHDSPDWIELYEASRSALSTHEPKVCGLCGDTGYFGGGMGAGSKCSCKDKKDGSK